MQGPKCTIACFAIYIRRGIKIGLANDADRVQKATTQDKVILYYSRATFQFLG